MRFIICKGLPASGKSTYAKEQCALDKDLIRVNKDDLREMFKVEFSYNSERAVFATERAIAKTVLAAGKSIIVDDTNFREDHFNYWINLAKEFNIEPEVVFFDTPVDECIRRDKKREKSVGAVVIRGMYNQYLKPKDVK